MAQHIRPKTRVEIATDRRMMAPVMESSVQKWFADLMTILLPASADTGDEVLHSLDEWLKTLKRKGSRSGPFAGGSLHQIANREDFRRRRAISVAADPARSINELERKTASSIKRDDPRRRLIRQNHRSLVLRQPMCRSFLFFPAEPTLRVVGKFDVIRRIGINEVIAMQGNRRKIGIGELPTRKQTLIFQEVCLVIDLLVLAKRHVE